MRFFVMFYGFILFFICLLAHIILWRSHHPKRQILTLYITFFTPPILLQIFLYIFNSYCRPSHFAAPEIICIYLLHYALSLAYIFTYPAAQAGCPTFIILFIIKSLMPKGATKDYIYSYCLQKNLFGLGVKELIDEGLVVDKNGWLELSNKGRLLLKTFIFIRKLFGLPIGLG